MIKLIIGTDGILISVTLKSRAFFIFISPLYIGVRVAPTTDPYPGIVELCDYSIPRILSDWDRLYLVKRVPKQRIQ
jgi:hypothetical protein